jgi:mannose-6-phosphate isomerase-like protein (cupin superfamily)
MSQLPVILNLAEPVRVTRFPLGRFELFRVGGSDVGRAVYSPGWRWTEHVAPTVGTALCEVEHVGLVVRGRAAVRMRDGVERVLGPGDLFHIPPVGHDSWVVGPDEYESVHFLGANAYAGSRQPTSPAAGLTPSAGDLPVPGPISKDNAHHEIWREVCDGWTLASSARLHVIQERMPPSTFELRHRHAHTQQFYYVLDGEATVDIDGRRETLTAGTGIEIHAGVTHQLRNDSAAPLEFLVISSQPPRHDRIDLP